MSGEGGVGVLKGLEDEDNNWGKASWGGEVVVSKTLGTKKEDVAYCSVMTKGVEPKKPKIGSIGEGSCGFWVEERWDRREEGTASWH